VARLLDAAGVVDGDHLEVGGLTSMPAAEEVAACEVEERDLMKSGQFRRHGMSFFCLLKTASSRQLRAIGTEIRVGARGRETHRCGRNR
jgi:hypothetical protein